MLALMAAVLFDIAQAQADIVTLQSSVNALPVSDLAKMFLNGNLAEASQHLTQSQTNYNAAVSYDQRSAAAYAAGYPAKGAIFHDLAVQHYGWAAAFITQAKVTLTVFKSYVDIFVPLIYQQVLIDQANAIIAEI